MGLFHFPASRSYRSTSATCSTRVVSSMRRKLAFDVDQAAEIAADDGIGGGGLQMLTHFRSAMAAEMSPNLTAKVPPKPQQDSASRHLPD